MSIYHDDNSHMDDMIRDVSDKHCPQSVRESAYRELEERGLKREDAQAIADRRHGDFW